MAEAIPIGDAVEGVKARVLDAMLAGDVPCEGPRLWGVLSSAACEARRRNVEISVLKQGFLVHRRGKSEIVTFEQADLGVLDRAIDRLAPLPEDGRL